jgi:hypothetical protein
MLTQQGHDLPPMWALPEASEGFQQGQIAFPGPVLVDALTIGDPRVFRGHELGRKYIDQGSLAKAQLPSDESDLPLSLAHRGPPLPHLGQ